MPSPAHRVEGIGEIEIDSGMEKAISLLSGCVPVRTSSSRKAAILEVVHSGILDVEERLVTFGGTESHTRIFSSGASADLRGRSLCCSYRYDFRIPIK